MKNHLNITKLSLLLIFMLNVSSKLMESNTTKTSNSLYKPNRR